MEHICIGKVYRLSETQFLPIGIDEAWQFFSDPKNLARITPEKMNFKILSGAEEKTYPGQIIQYKVFPFKFMPVTWVTEITHCKTGEYFVDEQRYGPYDLWHHKHLFKVVEGGIEMTDIVDYKIPFGRIGRFFLKSFIKKELTLIFEHRKNTLNKMFRKD